MKPFLGFFHLVQVYFTAECLYLCHTQLRMLILHKHNLNMNNWDKLSSSKRRNIIYFYIVHAAVHVETCFLSSYFI